MAQLLNKSPELYNQEKKAFLKELKHFHDQRGTPFKRIPNINGKEIDLYHLYWVVTAHGGWEKVNSRNAWEDFLETFELGQATTNAALGLKQIYLRYLDSYEKYHFLGEDEDREDDWYNDEEESRSRRQKAQKLHASVPLSYNHGQHNVNENLRSYYGFSTNVYRRTDYDRLTLSLSSPLPNEQDFAINTCTLLSNEGKHTLKLAKCERLLDHLLAHAGVYNDESYRVYMENQYLESRNYDLYSFWKDVCHLESVRQLILRCDDQKSSSFSSSRRRRRIHDDKSDSSSDDNSEGIMSLPSPKQRLNAVKRKAKSEIEDARPGSPSIFAIGRLGGTQELTGQRVRQIATIIRNLSFEEENAQIIAKSIPCLRFCLLCASSKWSNLNQMGFDILSNIAGDMILDDSFCENTHLTEILLSTIISGISSSDRFQVISSLDVLNKLCLQSRNEHYLENFLGHGVYSQLIAYLSLHDIHLLISTLECLYSLSSLGEISCNSIARISGAVDSLVSLTTAEAQSYGPKACVLMRVVEYVPGGAPLTIKGQSPCVKPSVKTPSTQVTQLSNVRPQQIIRSQHPHTIQQATQMRTVAPISQIGTTYQQKPTQVVQLAQGASGVVKIPIHSLPVVRHTMTPQQTRVTQIAMNAPVAQAVTQQQKQQIPAVISVQSPNISVPIRQAFSQPQQPQLQITHQQQQPQIQLTQPHLQITQQPQLQITQQQPQLQVTQQPSPLQVTPQQLSQIQVTQQQPQLQVVQQQPQLHVVQQQHQLQVVQQQPQLQITQQQTQVQISNSQEAQQTLRSQQVSLRINNDESNRQLCLSWLRATYETCPISHIEQFIMYKQYLASMHKMGREDVISDQHHVVCVRTLFGGDVGPNSKLLPNGKTERHFEGVKVRAVPQPLRLPAVNNQVETPQKPPQQSVVLLSGNNNSRCTPTPPPVIQTSQTTVVPVPPQSPILTNLLHRKSPDPKNSQVYSRNNETNENLDSIVPKENKLLKVNSDDHKPQGNGMLANLLEQKKDVDKITVNGAIGGVVTEIIQTVNGIEYDEFQSRKRSTVAIEQPPAKKIILTNGGGMNLDGLGEKEEVITQQVGTGNIVSSSVGVQQQSILMNSSGQIIVGQTANVKTSAPQQQQLIMQQQQRILPPGTRIVSATSSEGASTVQQPILMKTTSPPAITNGGTPTTNVGGVGQNQKTIIILPYSGVLPAQQNVNTTINTGSNSVQNVNGGGIPSTANGAHTIMVSSQTPSNIISGVSSNGPPVVSPSSVPSAPTPPPQMQEVVLKPNPACPFLCEWSGCMKAFKTPKEVENHAIKAHCPIEMDDIPCLWSRCDGMKRKRFSLMTHIQDRHCHPQLMKLMAVRRVQLAQNGKSDVPLPPAPPPHPGYAPNAAYHAIKRHALEFVSPKEMAMRDEKEGPVTKSIRLTSSLILKNLVIYSALGKSKLRAYESHLSTVALSNVESSRTMSQILYDMSEKDQKT
ncbi:SWI/SNF nucleosome remodeling complex component [Lepeophtheirus salmonis]|uniref:SWI/SNF nucleosome remodeling complex component n=1 Tax=Lepeophtheirus salmonis TaxID=72036 RepID=UPI001AE64167|nr:AT-rich interactive domain-containing protein 2-like [Lepeophtheirus salmonis]